MQKRHIDRQQYFQELAHTSEKYYIPFVEKYISLSQDTRILEIGCGEGGNLYPFVKKGCQVVGIDISATRIEQAKTFFSAHPFPSQPELIAADIFTVNEYAHFFDLVLVHDVIEHIPDKSSFIRHIGHFLKPKGIIFMGFPAWQMPFGGHQQICRNFFISHCPYLHLLPTPLYKMILKTGREPEGIIREMLSIKQCGISIEQFRRYIREQEYSIEKEVLYFINPHYESKFGLKPRKLSSLIGQMPWIRNFFTTSCFYLLRKQN